jgi:YgiT-type zinc finger domain-containing protein
MENICDVCGARTHEERTITHLFHTPDGEEVLIGNIPATVCVQCGEISFSYQTAQHIGEIVQAVAQKTLVATREIPLYDFA